MFPEAAVATWRVERSVRVRCLVDEVDHDNNIAGEQHWHWTGDLQRLYIERRGRRLAHDAECTQAASTQDRQERRGAVYTRRSLSPVRWVLVSESACTSSGLATRIERPSELEVVTINPET